VRVYREKNGKKGRWMMQPDDLKGLTPEQIRDKFALPKTPMYIAEVRLPKDSILQVGRAGSQEKRGWGEGGGWQYEFLEYKGSNRLASTCYKKDKPIEEYLNEKYPNCFIKRP